MSGAATLTMGLTMGLTVALTMTFATSSVAASTSCLRTDRGHRILQIILSDCYTIAELGDLLLHIFRNGARCCLIGHLQLLSSSSIRIELGSYRLHGG